MTEFETVLQGCLQDLEQGRASVEQCLSRYPAYASQLEPILLAGAYLDQARSTRISDAFKKRVRTKLVQELYARPRRPARFSFPFMRFALSLAAVLLAFLIVGTVYAQRTLPGQAFYSWKLGSENVWRAVSPDPVQTDLLIAGRRAEEVIAVKGDPLLAPQALQAYLEVSNRLKSEVTMVNQARVLAVLDSQIKELQQSGALIPASNQAIPTQSNMPTMAPTLTTIPTSTATPLSTVIPQVAPTDLPQVVPTIQLPTKILPTVEIPPIINPTLHSPPNIAPETQLPVLP